MLSSILKFNPRQMWGGFLHGGSIKHLTDVVSCFRITLLIM